MCCWKYLIICFQSQMNLKDIPFIMHVVWNVVCASCGAATASTLAGRFSTRFRMKKMRIIYLYSLDAYMWFQTLMTDEKTWLRLRSGICANWSCCSNQDLSVSLWNFLCPIGSNPGQGFARSSCEYVHSRWLDRNKTVRYAWLFVSVLPEWWTGQLCTVLLYLSLNES